MNFGSYAGFVIQKNGGGACFLFIFLSASTFLLKFHQVPLEDRMLQTLKLLEQHF